MPEQCVSTGASTVKTVPRVPPPTSFKWKTWGGNVNPPVPELALYALLWLQLVANLQHDKWKQLVKTRLRNKEELGLSDGRDIKIPTKELVRGKDRSASAEVTTLSVLEQLEPVVKALMRPDLLLMNSNICHKPWAGVSFTADELRIHIDRVHQQDKGKAFRWKGETPRWNARPIRDQWWVLLENVDFLCDAVALLLDPPSPLPSRARSAAPASCATNSSESSLSQVTIAGVRCEREVELADARGKLSAAGTELQETKATLKASKTALEAAEATIASLHAQQAHFERHLAAAQALSRPSRGHASCSCHVKSSEKGPYKVR